VTLKATTAVRRNPPNMMAASVLAVQPRSGVSKWNDCLDDPEKGFFRSSFIFCQRGIRRKSGVNDIRGWKARIIEPIPLWREANASKDILQTTRSHASYWRSPRNTPSPWSER
jgi:hypothetical protein